MAKVTPKTEDQVRDEAKTILGFDKQETKVQQGTGQIKTICLLITSCLQPIAEKYSYNYGLFPNLLKEEIVKLPADVNGEPDYEYMEKYMRKVESKAYNVIGCLTAV